MASKLVAQLFDRTYSVFTNDIICSLQLTHDYFEGHHYTPHEFFESYSRYFDQPHLFYRDFNMPTQTEMKQVGANDKMHFKMYAFPSPVETTWKENNTAYFRHFSAQQPSDVLLLFAPGWARKNLNAEMNFCKRLLNHGIDSCLLTKPFHQERTPKDLSSGELFISHHVFLTIKNFQQFVSEMRFLLRYFKPKYKYIGLIGMSSGGFQTGLVLDTEYADFYFPIITGAKLGSIAWNGRLSVFLRKQVAEKGFTEDDLNKVWAISDQHYLGHNVKAKHIKQFISLYDEVVPTDNQYLLWEIYNKPPLTKLHCAHISIYFYLNRVADDIARFVKERI